MIKIYNIYKINKDNINYLISAMKGRQNINASLLKQQGESE